MKQYQLILIILLIGLLGCQSSKNKIIINGKIIGKLPEKVDYTSPINGICNWYFTESVQPDSIGNFQISLNSKKPIFIKLRTSYKNQGTLIVEPGKTYDLIFDLNLKENIFSVTDKSSIYQTAYNKLPNPSHIQIGAREFMRDSVASAIKETIEKRRAEEIVEFEKYCSDKTISQEIFNLIKIDRNCYYDAVLATTVWIKKLMSLQGRGNFTNEFENLWQETFKQILFSNPEIINSQWFNFYSECYIYFQEYMNGNFTKEKLDSLNKSNQTKIYRVSKAKEYLPSEICEDYLANYLYEESFQKKYEKELVDLFKNFKLDYPDSKYIPYISPLIDEIIKFHKVADSEFNEQITFIENYRNLNTLTEVTNTFPEGKIYVDVWATWCGPCKEEFEHKKELNNLLKKKNIQMLYISIDREQDSVQWKNMIKFYNLEGNHVRANVELSDELRKIFDKNGSISIPWYILTDKNGNIIIRHASSPSQIEKLEKQLNEK